METDGDLETDGETGLSGGEAGNYPLIFGGVTVFVLACCGIIGCLVLRWQIEKRVAKKVGSMQQERAAASGIAPLGDAPADDGLMIWPDLVTPSGTFFGEGGGGEIVSAASDAASGPLPPPLTMTVMSAAYDCYEQMKGSRPPTDEAALLCLLKAGETALAAEGAIGPARLNAGQLAALGSFGEQAGRPEGAGQGADLRGALQMLHRSISSHLSLARGAKYRAASGGLRWTDRCVAPDRLAAPVSPTAGRRSRSPAGRYQRRQQTADSSRGSSAVPPPPASGSLEDMRWSPSGQRMGSSARLPAPTPSKKLSTVAKIMFDRYDLDGSGAIDKAELAALCAQLGRDLNPVELDGVMAKLDADGNGSVGFDEFMWWWGLGLSVAALQDETELAKLRQVAADGVARRQQAQDAAPTNATILEVFGTFDRDGNGTLDVKELSAALRELGLNLDGGGGLSTKGILARYGGDASRSIDVGEFTQLVLELHEAVVLHGSSTGKASVIQSERDEMRTTDHLPTGKSTASGKARARAALQDGGEKSSPGRRVYRPRRPAGTSDADPFSSTLPQNFSGAEQGSAALARDASPRSAAVLDPEPSDVQYDV